MPTPRPDPAAHAALALAHDAVAAEISGMFEANSIPAILLKGASTAAWLYPNEVRSYEDCDLLVPFDRRDRAADCLRRAGFAAEPVVGVDGRPDAWAPSPWSRGFARADLHVSFWGIPAHPRDVWPILFERTETLTVANRPVCVLDVAARSLLVALHAFHHGPGHQGPLRDFERALAAEPLETWREAAAVAAKLGAETALDAALRARPVGVEVAEELGLRRGRLRSALAVGGLPYSEGLERLAASRGRDRIRLALAELLPAPVFMRARYPEALRGRMGLARAYVRRLAGTVGFGVRLLRAWARRP